MKKDKAIISYLYDIRKEDTKEFCVKKASVFAIFAITNEDREWFEREADDSIWKESFIEKFIGKANPEHSLL